MDEAISFNTLRIASGKDVLAMTYIWIKGRR